MSKTCKECGEWFGVGPPDICARCALLASDGEHQTLSESLAELERTDPDAPTDPRGGVVTAIMGRDPARQIEELWSAERCSWDVRFLAPWWTVSLVWTQEYGPHHAEWATFTWEFDAHSVNAALLDAADFCVGLARWAPCDDCDGKGEWGGFHCATCNRTGLASASTGAPQ